MYKKYFKGIVDFTGALILLIIFSPILLITTLLLLLANGGNAFFYQIRPGKYGRLFSIIKFKTMNDFVDQNGELKKDAERLTALGSFIRKSSIDELPQLINVLKGDMSLIGPRPLLPEYMPLYSDEQSRRHECKPGITGWAQVNGRNAISWVDKFKYDVWYVDHISLLLDLKILLLTIKKVIIKEGITSGTSVTMEKFTGN